MRTACSSQVVAKASDLERCQRDFLQALETQGYSSWTLRQYGLTVERFLAAVGDRGDGESVLEEQQLRAIQEAVVQTAAGAGRRYAMYRVSKFIDHLVDAGLANRAILVAPAETPRERLRCEYQTYLRVQRGVSESTAYHCVRFYERFLTFRFGEGLLGDLDQISPDEVVDFLVKVTQVASGAKTPPTHLRSLFQFLFWSGKTTKNLAESIPRGARRPAPGQPRCLSPGEVQQLIDAVRADDAIGRRNYALLLLMARLGLRATEVIAIRLEDIDWRAGELLVRGKGKLHDRMPLPAEVGAALVGYLQHGRQGNSRTLFVTHRAPHGPLVNGQIVNDLLRKAFAKTGLKPPQKYVGSHLLRHSLATGMLRGGASLDEIGDTLRHRSRMTTTIYAKLDLEGLRSIAQQWPDSGGAS